MMRRTSRAQETLLDENAADDASIEHGRSGALRDGLNSLSPDQQTVVALFYRDGLAVAEIAEALSIPAGGQN